MIKKIIEGFPNYEITNCGKVFKGSKQIAGVLSCSAKYRKACLIKDGKKYYRDIHRLVAQAFIGNVKGLVVNHKDFNGHNNKVDNLEIVTQKENVAYTIKNKRHCFGSRHHKIRITDKNLLISMCLRNFGFKYSEIEKEFNFTKNTLLVALRNRVYKHHQHEQDLS